MAAASLGSRGKALSTLPSMDSHPVYSHSYSYLPFTAPTNSTSRSSSLTPNSDHATLAAGAPSPYDHLTSPSGSAFSTLSPRSAQAAARLGFDCPTSPRSPHSNHVESFPRDYSPFRRLAGAPGAWAIDMAAGPEEDLFGDELLAPRPGDSFRSDTVPFGFAPFGETQAGACRGKAEKRDSRYTGGGRPLHELEIGPPHQQPEDFQGSEFGALRSRSHGRQSGASLACRGGRLSEDATAADELASPGSTSAQSEGRTPPPRLSTAYYNSNPKRSFSHEPQPGIPRAPQVMPEDVLNCQAGGGEAEEWLCHGRRMRAIAPGENVDPRRSLDGGSAVLSQAWLGFGAVGGVPPGRGGIPGPGGSDEAAGAAALNRAQERGEPSGRLERFGSGSPGMGTLPAWGGLGNVGGRLPVVSTLGSLGSPSQPAGAAAGRKSGVADSGCLPPHIGPNGDVGGADSLGRKGAGCGGTERVMHGQGRGAGCLESGAAAANESLRRNSPCCPCSAGFCVPDSRAAAANQTDCECHIDCGGELSSGKPRATWGFGFLVNGGNVGGVIGGSGSSSSSSCHGGVSGKPGRSEDEDQDNWLARPYGAHGPSKGGQSGSGSMTGPCSCEAGLWPHEEKVGVARGTPLLRHAAEERVRASTAPHRLSWEGVREGRESPVVCRGSPDLRRGSHPRISWDGGSPDGRSFGSRLLATQLVSGRQGSGGSFGPFGPQALMPLDNHPTRLQGQRGEEEGAEQEQQFSGRFVRISQGRAEKYQSTRLTIGKEAEGSLGGGNVGAAGREVRSSGGEPRKGWSGPLLPSSGGEVRAPSPQARERPWASKSDLEDEDDPPSCTSRSSSSTSSGQFQPRPPLSSGTPSVPPGLPQPPLADGRQSAWGSHWPAAFLGASAAEAARMAVERRKGLSAAASVLQGDKSDKVSRARSDETGFVVAQAAAAVGQGPEEGSLRCASGTFVMLERGAARPRSFQGEVPNSGTGGSSSGSSSSSNEGETSPVTAPPTLDSTAAGRSTATLSSLATNSVPTDPPGAGDLDAPPGNSASSEDSDAVKLFPLTSSQGSSQTSAADPLSLGPGDASSSLRSPTAAVPPGPPAPERNQPKAPSRPGSGQGNTARLRLHAELEEAEEGEFEFNLDKLRLRAQAANVEEEEEDRGIAGGEGRSEVSKTSSTGASTGSELAQPGGSARTPRPQSGVLKHQRRSSSGKLPTEELQTGGSSDCRHFSSEELHSATKGYANARLLGKGGSGSVFRGQLFGCDVAVKRLEQGTERGAKELRVEVGVLSRVRHPNIVLLMGHCPEEAAIVYEYMPGGNLNQRLRLGTRARSPLLTPLSWCDRFRVAAEITGALLFLHCHAPPILHGDIKPDNVLLDRGGSAKIGDVGLARLIPEGAASVPFQAQGTVGFMDPESFTTGEQSVASDVYSLGLVLLQLFTGLTDIKKVHAHLGGLGPQHPRDLDLASRIFLDLLDPAAAPWPLDLARRALLVALQCVEKKATDRPDLAGLAHPELLSVSRAADDELQKQFDCLDADPF